MFEPTGCPQQPGWRLTDLDPESAATIPWVNRFHQHIFNDPANGATLEEWRFQKLGDIRVVGRYQLVGLPEYDHAAGVQFGLKLPTGSTTVVNRDGDRAERPLQPGTGTTDLILGTYYNAPFGDGNSTWFVQALVTSALNSNEDFRPGLHVALNTGLNYAVNDTVSALLQLNLSDKGRDSGAQAEPANSGSRQVFLSPGLSVAVSRMARLYGFMQLPLYQYVNGTQLTADRAYIIGWTQVF